MSKYNELLLSQIQLAHELSSVLEDEKYALESNQIEMLVELSRQKATLLEKFSHLQQEREHVYKASENPENEETKSLQIELTTIVEQCTQQNHVNGAVISLCQSKVRTQLGLLLGEENLVSLYSAKGQPLASYNR